MFDNTKIKRFVPDYGAKVPFVEGVRRAVAWFDADESRRQIDEEADARWDKLIAAYEAGLDLALNRYRG